MAAYVAVIAVSSFLSDSYHCLSALIRPWDPLYFFLFPMLKTSQPRKL